VEQELKKKEKIR
jgi:peptide subunit release factor RF-3